MFLPTTLFRRAPAAGMDSDSESCTSDEDSEAENADGQEHDEDAADSDHQVAKRK